MFIMYSCLVLIWSSQVFINSKNKTILYMPNKMKEYEILDEFPLQGIPKFF